MSSLLIQDHPSPNFDQRRTPPDMLVIHYTGMPSASEALTRLTDPAAKVSSHYLIDEDGAILRLVPEERRAWHAGRSYWKGERDCNSVSVGIELVNPGHEWGYRAFPAPQIDALKALIDEIRSRWTIPNGRIVGHSDIAPDRKIDPGELFPWQELAKAGHGLWVDVAAAPGAPLSLGDEGVGVFALQAGLYRLGYDTPPSGQLDEETLVNLLAFQRHWRPDQVDGVADGETRARLVALLRQGAIAEAV